MKSILTTLSLFIIGLHKGIICEREHKVHNIVLYPEKHSWCQITPIQQVVGSPGYDSVTIDNNVCVGACYSYSIPKTQPAEPGELIGPYCDSCQPSEIKCYHVNLKQSSKDIEGPKILQKKVQIITNCSCQSCDFLKNDSCEITDNNTMELPENLFIEKKNASALDDAADLLEANNTAYHTSVHDIKLKNKLKKWFETYWGNEGNDIKITKDLDSLPPNSGNEDLSRRHNVIRVDIQDNENIIAIDDLANKPEIKVPDYGNHHHGVHQHHVGEEQQIGERVEHLIKGPHGSLVAAPVEAKFHIDSDDLKPNDEGIIINYENHDFDHTHHHHHHHHHHPSHDLNHEEIN